MTPNTHLDRAAECIRHSDASLLEAAEHIRQAMKTDASLTLDAAGEYLNRSGDWVRALLHWAESAEDGETLFSGDTQSRLRRATAQGLRDLPDEDLDDAVADHQDRVEASLERVRIAAITAEVERKKLAGKFTPYESPTREQMFSRIENSVLAICGWTLATDEEKLDYAARLRAAADTLEQSVAQSTVAHDQLG